MDTGVKFWLNLDLSIKFVLSKFGIDIFYSLKNIRFSVSLKLLCFYRKYHVQIYRINIIKIYFLSIKNPFLGAFFVYNFVAVFFNYFQSIVVL